MGFDSDRLVSLCARQVSIESLESFLHVSPYDESFKRRVFTADSNQIDLACQSASEFMKAVRVKQVTSEKMLVALRSVAHHIKTNAYDYASIECRWTSRAYQELFNDSIPKACETILWFCQQQQEDALRANIYPDHSYVDYVRDPIGVIAAVTPWNDPLVAFSWKVVPALLSGNAVIWKPSEYCCETAYWIVQSLWEAGIERERLQLILGGGETGRNLVQHPLVDGIAFTGSFETALSIAHGNGHTRLKTIHVEAGGKGCAYVNLTNHELLTRDWIGKIAKASFYNQGQICSAPTILLVHERNIATVIDHLKRKAINFHPGNPTILTSQVGGLITKQKKEELLSLISGAVDFIHLTPLDSSPTGFAPTLVLNPLSNSSFIRDELFGPILVIVECRDVYDAVTFINNQSYGLANGIFSSDAMEIEFFSKSTGGGIIHINNWGEDTIGVPFGGVKNSGSGKEKCIDSLNHFTNVKPICRTP